LAASVAALIVVIFPASSLAGDPAGIDRFMWAIGKVESGGRYDARNPKSGAYGKYQIIPSSWRAWAALYLGNANAKPTPANQEKVARAKFRALYRKYESWRYVAYTWLTGRDGRDGAWSSTAKTYVARVMKLYRSGGGGGDHPRVAKVVSEVSKSIAYSGDWAFARHAAYQGGRVRYATDAGATATITLTGRGISWIGPQGPTRGKARISVDGKVVATVDLGSSRFRARTTIWQKRWAAAGRHTVMIEVLGTRGRPYVAIDGFLVRP
jgi:hypothetical protein